MAARSAKSARRVNSSREAPSSRGDYKPNTGNDLDELVHPDWPRDGVPSRIRDLQRGRAIHVGHQQRELVAAEPGDDGVRGDLAQPLGDLDQHLIAAGIADRIVHLIEAIEIDDSISEGPVLGTGGKALVEQIEQLAVVGQAGERVLVGELVHLLLAPGEKEAAPAELPHRQRCKTDQAQHDERNERGQLGHHRGRRPLGFPGEPTDDTALAVDHRLDRTIVIRGVGVEFQPLKTREACEHRDEARLDAAQRD